MKRRVLLCTLGFLLGVLFSLAQADDAVCFDPNGNVVEKYVSVDLHTVGILSQNDTWLRDECVRVSREAIKEIEGKKIDVSAVKPQESVDSEKGNYIQDEAVTEKSVEEVNLQKDIERTEAEARDNFIRGLQAKLKQMGFTDEEITFIIGFGSDD